MINIGAITTHSLVGEAGLSVEVRSERLRRGLSAFAARELAVDDSVFTSELGTAYRNLARAHMARSRGTIAEDPAVLVREYVRQCALLVDVRDLAVMAATLAHHEVTR